jgi:DNA-directed RNA polymerase specialized sigma24 family protein
MKIKYEFADGTVSEVEVEESIGAVIIESRRKEDNLARKERYHCYSMDAVQFEGDEYGTEETPETQMERELDTERIAHALDGLSEVQRRRLLKFAEGKSMREIAREEKVQHRAVMKSIESARKIFKKNF